MYVNINKYGEITTKDCIGLCTPFPEEGPNYQDITKLDIDDDKGYILLIHRVRHAPDTIDE